MATTWDTLYKVDPQVFGRQPSVLWAYISNDPWVRQHCKAALEIGGGYGRDAHFMVSNGVPKVVNVDMSSEAIKQARDRTEKTLFSEVEHVCDDIFGFEPKGQTFDLTSAITSFICSHEENYLNLQESYTILPVIKAAPHICLSGKKTKASL